LVSLVVWECLLLLQHLGIYGSVALVSTRHGPGAVAGPTVLHSRLQALLLLLYVEHHLLGCHRIRRRFMAILLSPVPRVPSGVPCDIAPVETDAIKMDGRPLPLLVMGLVVGGAIPIVSLLVWLLASPVLLLLLLHLQLLLLLKLLLLLSQHGCLRLRKYVLLLVLVLLHHLLPGCMLPLLVMNL
jgi:hypothetical protein